MKIRIVRASPSSKLEAEVNEELCKLINDGFMIIDFNIVPSGDSKYPCSAQIRYCDKQFLRDYKIRSIMNEL